jgi:hypothetical protein
VGLLAAGFATDIYTLIGARVLTGVASHGRWSHL